MTGASWLEPLYTAEEMRALDTWAIDERGIPSLDLMENAGRRRRGGGRGAGADRPRADRLRKGQQRR